MLLYVLDPDTFDRVAVIEEYESDIWAERFIDPGDVTLVVADTETNSKLLRPGIILENEDSDIPMLLENAEVKDGALTLTGKTLETFFNQRSLGPRSYAGSPRHILCAIVNDMQNQFGGTYSIPGVTVTVPSGGTAVTEKIVKREKVHDLLLRIAKKYVVGMYVHRIQNEFGYQFEFKTYIPSDLTDSNEDGYATVRFSPEDDNLVGVHEVYSSISNVEAVVVHVPARFTGSGEIGEDLQPVIWGSGDIPPSGIGEELVSPTDLNLSPFDTRLKELDGEKLTVEYLKKQMHRYYGGTPPEWGSITTAAKSSILLGEMVRMAEAEYKKTRGVRKRAIDGEIATNTLRFGTDYDLGDMVEVTTALEDGMVFGKRPAMVTEYIRSADATGIRAYPTLSQPSTSAPYDDSPDQQPEEAGAGGGDGDHTFSINGLLPADLEILSPHMVTVTSGQTKQIASIGQIGPRYGDCTLYFMRNGSYFDESDLPLTLANGDEITVDPTDHDEDAGYVSGVFKIDVS